jgi:chloride channel, nucleotide-sensitive, 1A
LTLFSHNSGTGIQIPYPAITLHAIKNFRHLEKPEDAASKFIGVYMQLEFSDSAEDSGDEFLDPIELTLIPSKATSAEQPTIDALNSERATALFNQISACSNLNPDPHNEDDDDDVDDADRIIFEGEHEALEGFTGVLRGDTAGGLPPPMPGSSGWITADNVHEYFDEEGNWIGDNGDVEGVSGELGEGAGRVRGRDEVEGEAGADGNAAVIAANGHKNDEDNEAKRPRTE